MADDIFDQFSWHSSIGIDETLMGNKRFVTRVPNTSRTRKAFVKVAGDDGNMLIHKTTRALWRISDDKMTIEPVFQTDVLTDQDVEKLMED